MCSRIKDSIPMDKITGVVHQVNCSNCEASSVGETLRSVGTRFDEQAMHTRNCQIDLSVVGEHAKMEAHTIDWKGAKILESERGTIDATHEVKEALMI